MNHNILIVGVGGQGTLLASRVLGNYALKQGIDCKLSEVHGMAQRGGSVITHVRFGKKVYSPIIREGEADIIISFEKLEAARWRHYLKKDGVMIVNDTEIPPLPVITGAMRYPHDALEEKEGAVGTVVTLNASSMAADCGNIKAVNTLMLGTLASRLNFDYESIRSAVAEEVPAKALEINLKAFEAGFHY